MKKISRFWVLLIPAALLLCFCKALLLPKTMNTYENRYAYAWKAPTAQTVSDGSFQKSAENALTDQVPLAQTMKRIYNRVHTGVQKALMRPIWNAHPERYFSFSGLQIFGSDCIVYRARSLADMAQALDDKAENLNTAIARHPELEFFVYYIEKDTDLDFVTGQKVGAGDYLIEQLELSPDHTAIFRVDGFPAFRQNFYRTDHHWNWEGSYRGYCQVAGLLGIEPLRPVGEAVKLGSFSGAKAATSGAQKVFYEDFCAYEYDFPPMTVTVDGISQSYGNQAGFLYGSAQNPDYGAFYGHDNGEVIFDTGADTGENLLVIGDSFDNAILQLLSSSFRKTYAVDLRYYEAKTGTAFDLRDYTAQHSIGQVLLLGNIDYYTMADFMLEG